MYVLFLAKLGYNFIKCLSLRSILKEICVVGFCFLGGFFGGGGVFLVVIIIIFCCFFKIVTKSLVENKPLFELYLNHNCLSILETLQIKENDYISYFFIHKYILLNGIT